MMEYYYEIALAVSFVLTLVYAFMWHKRFDLFITLLFVFIPISNLGYVFRDQANTLDTAIAGTKILYIGGCFNVVFILFSGFALCRIKLPKPVYGALLTLNSAVYTSILTIGSAPLYYKNVGVRRIGGTVMLTKEYGPMHTVFIIMIAVYSFISLAVMIHTLIRKKEVSRHIVFLLFLLEMISALSYLFKGSIGDGRELVPYTYILAQLIFLLIVRRISLYDITDTAIDSLVETGGTGFISLDFNYRYLGSNETAKGFFPELKELYVDKPVPSDKAIGPAMTGWTKEFAADERFNTQTYPRDGKIYLISINYLFDGKRKRGFQLFITDDTKNQMYSTMLENEVEEKTRHLVEMHDKLILSMATMVESRDNSTGGHIRRTSDAVRILIEEMKKDEELGLTERFCRNMIKAAPMHDLGKIAVDDAILRKPGRFTPEEFEKMKSHSAEGAKIVHKILEGTDDIEFHILAENVAHYHHERWDGSGYPDGLSGEQIPFEARIMAIADVYDALVSKRVYKEKMSFEQANKIIMEGMGTHFDKRLEKYYSAARPALEAYYSALE